MNRTLVKVLISVFLVLILMSTVSSAIRTNLQAVAQQPAIIAARRLQPTEWPLAMNAGACDGARQTAEPVASSVSLRRWQGTLALACGDTSSTRGYLEPLLTVSSHPIVPVLIAASYLADGELEQAKATLGQQAVILWRSFVTQAAQAYQYGDIDEAVNWLDQARSLIADTDSNSFLAFYERGCIIYRDANRSAEAIETCTRLTEEAALTGTNWLMLGRAWLAAGDYQQALSATQRAAQLDENDGPTHYYLGLAYEGLADADHAWQAYQRAVELAPTYGTVRLHLAEWELARGNVAAARLQLEAARQSDSAYARQQAERKLAELNTP